MLVWSSARPLFKYLCREVIPTFNENKKSNQRQKQQLNVLELGSGTGILGLCVAAKGCDVVLTDPGIEVNLSEEKSGNTIEHLRRNLEYNLSVVEQG